MKSSVKSATLVSVLSCVLCVSIMTIPTFQSLTSLKAVDAKLMAEPTIIINETECTWYGDFIVNATDTVLIENCDFTVENGRIENLAFSGIAIS